MGADQRALPDLPLGAALVFLLLVDALRLLALALCSGQGALGGALAAGLLGLLAEAGFVAPAGLAFVGAAGAVES